MSLEKLIKSRINFQKEYLRALEELKSNPPKNEEGMEEMVRGMYDILVKAHKEQGSVFGKTFEQFVMEARQKTAERWNEKQ